MTKISLAAIYILIMILCLPCFEDNVIADTFLIFETTPEQISQSTDKTIEDLNKCFRQGHLAV